MYSLRVRHSGGGCRRNHASVQQSTHIERQPKLSKIWLLPKRICPARKHKSMVKGRSQVEPRRYDTMVWLRRTESLCQLSVPFPTLTPTKTRPVIFCFLHTPLSFREPVFISFHSCLALHSPAPILHAIYTCSRVQNPHPTTQKPPSCVPSPPSWRVERCLSGCS